MALSAAHLGELARATRHAAARVTGAWGLESSEMVRRYAHFSADDLAPYADRLCALRVVDDSCQGTNSAHPAIKKGAGAANPLI